jgi:hypothetical protein
MSGSRTKQLRREALAHGLTRTGFRNLKRAWTETPRPDRRDFSVTEFAIGQKEGDMRKLEAHLARQPRGVLERLYRRITGRK